MAHNEPGSDGSGKELHLLFDPLKYEEDFWESVQDIKTLVTSPSTSKKQRMRKHDIQASKAFLCQETLSNFTPEKFKKLDLPQKVSLTTTLKLLLLHDIFGDEQQMVDQIQDQYTNLQTSIDQLLLESVQGLTQTSSSLKQSIEKIKSTAQDVPKPILDLKPFQCSNTTIRAKKFAQHFVSQVDFNYTRLEALKIQPYESSLRKLRQNIGIANQGRFFRPNPTLAEGFNNLLVILNTIKEEISNLLFALSDHLDFAVTVLESIHHESFNSKYTPAIEIQNQNRTLLESIFMTPEPPAFPITCPSLVTEKEKVEIKNIDQYRMMKKNFEMTEELITKMNSSLPTTWPSTLPNFTTPDGHPRITVANAADFITIQGNYSSYLARMTTLKKEWSFILKECHSFLEISLKKNFKDWSVAEVQKWIQGSEFFQFSKSFAYVDGKSLSLLTPELLQKMDVPPNASVPLYLLIQNLDPIPISLRRSVPVVSTSVVQEKEKRDFPAKPKSIIIEVNDKVQSQAQLSVRASRIANPSQLVFKVLLLGISGTGKSTFFHQVRRQHPLSGTIPDGPSLQLHALKAIQNFLKIFKIEEKTKVKKRVVEPHIQNILKAQSCTPTVVSSYNYIWDVLIIAEGMIELIKSFPSTTINVLYVLQNFQRISSSTYSPIQNDLLHIFVPTFGSPEVSLPFLGSNFLIKDFGGRRTERQTWMAHFVDVAGIVFFVNLDDYDNTILDEEGKPYTRLEESLILWKKFTSAQFFAKTPFFWFFNREDLFKKKILVDPLSKYLNIVSQADGSNFKVGLEAMKSIFISGFNGEMKNLMVCETSVIEGKNSDDLFSKIGDSLFKRATDEEASCAPSPVQKLNLGPQMMLGPSPRDAKTPSKTLSPKPIDDRKDKNLVAELKKKDAEIRRLQGLLDAERAQLTKMEQWLSKFPLNK